MPIKLVMDVHSIQPSVEGNVLNELRMLPCAHDPDRRPQGALLDQLYRIGRVEFRELLLEVTVDIPGIVILRSVLEGNEFVATTVGGNELEFRSLVVEA